jgi:uncharacterized protein DUF6370
LENARPQPLRTFLQPEGCAPAGFSWPNEFEQEFVWECQMGVTSKSVNINMKINTVLAGVAGALLLAGTSISARAAEGKEVTLQGEAKCAKCALHEADKCQTVIQTKEDGKTVTYYVTQNDVAKTFHKEICQDPKKVKATGKVEEVDGKKQLTLAKITPAE